MTKTIKNFNESGIQVENIGGIIRFEIYDVDNKLFKQLQKITDFVDEYTNSEQQEELPTSEIVAREDHVFVVTNIPYEVIEEEEEENKLDDDARIKRIEEFEKYIDSYMNSYKCSMSKTKRLMSKYPWVSLYAGRGDIDGAEELVLDCLCIMRGKKLGSLKFKEA